MKIVFVYADNFNEFNTSRWRCVIPSDAINQSGKGHESYLITAQQWGSNTPDIQLLCQKADIIIVERNLFGGILDLIQYWQKQGKPVATTFDDAYQFMHEKNVSSVFWNQSQTKVVKDMKGNEVLESSTFPLAEFKKGLKLVDGILVPSKVLAEDWKSYNKTYFFNNYFDLSNYANIEPSPEHEDIYIGWGGSLSHYHSWMKSDLLPALKTICKKYPKVKVVIAGDERVYQKVELPKEKKIFQPFVPYTIWPHVINKFDIGLAPLSGAYDHRRSWIKPMEYMLMKKPFVASNDISYADIFSYGNFVSNSCIAWEKKLIDIIENRDVYNARVEKAYTFAIEQGVEHKVDEYIAIFQDIIDRFQDEKGGENNNKHGEK